MRPGENGGITLLELIVFILVGSFFIPLAYVAFTAAVKETSIPEYLVKARLIAESKMEDITSHDYASLPAPSSNYTAVNTDLRFNDVSYQGYQWKWNIFDTAYSDTSGHIVTTVQVPPQWQAGTYKIGDYVKFSGLFYRANYSVWQKAQPYSVGDYVIAPGAVSPNQHAYRCITTGMSGDGPDGEWSTVDGSEFCDDPGSPCSNVMWKTVPISPTAVLSSNQTPSTGDEYGKIRWIPMNPYKQIDVFVKVPNCSSDSCVYKVSSIITSRMGP